MPTVGERQLFSLTPSPNDCFHQPTRDLFTFSTPFPCSFSLFVPSFSPLFELGYRANSYSLPAGLESCSVFFPFSFFFGDVTRIFYIYCKGKRERAVDYGTLVSVFSSYYAGLVERCLNESCAFGKERIVLEGEWECFEVERSAFISL